VGKVVSDDLLLEAAVALAQDIAVLPYGNREALKQLSGIADSSLEEYLDKEEQLLRKSLAKIYLADSSDEDR